MTATTASRTAAEELAAPSPNQPNRPLPQDRTNDTAQALERTGDALHAPLFGRASDVAESHNPGRRGQPRSDGSRHRAR